MDKKTLFDQENIAPEGGIIRSSFSEELIHYADINVEAVFFTCCGCLHIASGSGGLMPAVQEYPLSSYQK